MSLINIKKRRKFSLFRIYSQYSNWMGIMPEKVGLKWAKKLRPRFLLVPRQYCHLEFQEGACARPPQALQGVVFRRFPGTGAALAKNEGVTFSPPQKQHNSHLI